MRGHYSGSAVVFVVFALDSPESFKSVD